MMRVQRTWSGAVVPLCRRHANSGMRDRVLPLNASDLLLHQQHLPGFSTRVPASDTSFGNKPARRTGTPACSACPSSAAPRRLPPCDPAPRCAAARISIVTPRCRHFEHRPARSVTSASLSLMIATFCNTTLRTPAIRIELVCPHLLRRDRNGSRVLARCRARRANPRAAVSDVSIRRMASYSPDSLRLSAGQRCLDGLADHAQHVQARTLLVVGRHDVSSALAACRCAGSSPPRPPGRRRRTAIGPVLGIDFEALQRILVARLEAAQLLCLAHLQPELRDDQAVLGQLALELADLVVGALPVRRARRSRARARPARGRTRSGRRSRCGRAPARRARSATGKDKSALPASAQKPARPGIGARRAHA